MTDRNGPPPEVSEDKHVVVTYLFSDGRRVVVPVAEKVFMEDPAGTGRMIGEDVADAHAAIPGAVTGVNPLVHRQSCIRLIESLRIELQPEHWNDWDIGFTAACDRIIEELRKGTGR